MLYHRHLPVPAPDDFPAIREVARWSGPTRVLVLTDHEGTKRLRVELLASDVTGAVLEALSGALGVIEDEHPAPVSSSPSCAVRELRLEAAPPQ